MTGGGQFVILNPVETESQFQPDRSWPALVPSVWITFTRSRDRSVSQDSDRSGSHPSSLDESAATTGPWWTHRDAVVPRPSPRFAASRIVRSPSLFGRIWARSRGGSATMNDPQEILGHCFELAGARAGWPRPRNVARAGASREFPDDGRLWQSIGVFRHQPGRLRPGWPGVGDGRSPGAARSFGPIWPWPSVSPGRANAGTGDRSLPEPDERSRVARTSCFPGGRGRPGAFSVMYGSALATCLELARRSPDDGRGPLRRGLLSPDDWVDHPRRSCPIIARAHELAAGSPAVSDLAGHAARSRRASRRSSAS